MKWNLQNVESSQHVSIKSIATERASQKAVIFSMTSLRGDSKECIKHGKDGENPKKDIYNHNEAFIFGYK